MDRVFFHTKWGKYVNFIFYKNTFFYFRELYIKLE